MDEALELTSYLPSSFKRQSDQDYVIFLWESFESNYKEEKYQFAYLSYHMLFMCFTYFNVWQIKNGLSPEFKTALTLKENIEKVFLEASSPFVFSKENERSVFAFLKLVGCPKEKIGNYKKLVDLRNDISHSNGNVYFSSAESLDEKIEDVLFCTREIQKFSKKVIQDSYRQFLLESWNQEEREFSDPLDQIREIFVHQHFLSEQDIQFCLAFDIESLSDSPNFMEIKSLHETFLGEYNEE